MATKEIRGRRSPIELAEIRRRHGEMVRTAREECEISQEVLAELSDTSQQTISRIEKGLQGAQDDLRVRIANALGVSAHDVFPYFEGDDGEDQ